jgi:PAS domain S-box-containing protein
MLVEDEAIISSDLQASLEDAGYEVVAIASSGPEAITMAQQTRPDLIIMDVMLRGDMDGIEAAGRIRETISSPVIYLTAFAHDAVLERAKQTEPFGYLIKPVQNRELYSTIEMALVKHQMEIRLRESREWFLVTLRSIADAVIAADQLGRVNFLNPVAEALTGRTQAEAEGKPLGEVFRITAAPEFGANEPGSMAGLFGEREDADHHPVLLNSKDGGLLHIDVAASDIRNASGEVIGVVIVFRDVSERRQVLERLWLLSSVVEQTTEGIAVVDLDGDLLFLNQAFSSMHGYTPEELTGQNLRVFHNPDQMSAVDEALAEIMKTGRHRGEIWQTRRDGSVFPGLMHNSVLRDAQGRPYGMIGLLRDITDLKQTEDALRESHEKLAAYSSSLETMVRERTLDLENSRRELKEYSESLEKTNEALKMIVRGIEDKKKEMDERLSYNLNLAVKPIIDQLKSQELPDAVSFLVQSLEFSIENMLSSFGVKLIKEGYSLTPRELRICEMIRSGLNSKQMAKVMGVTPQTILVHRKNIRRKLGLAKSRRNLASFLKAGI